MTPIIAELRLTRDLFGPAATLGRLDIRYLESDEWKPFGFVCEDVDRGLDASHGLDSIKRAKIKGQTAIPTGRYRLLKTWSPKYGANVWEVQAVPGFQGIRLHSGNTAADTEGCICPALDRHPEKWSTGRSKVAMHWIKEHLDIAAARGVELWIEVRSEQRPVT